LRLAKYRVIRKKDGVIAVYQAFDTLDLALLRPT
jgi:hypothetical protein